MKCQEPQKTVVSLTCGCQVCSDTGVSVSRCPRHVCYAVMRFHELQEPVSLPAMELPRHPDGLKPLCPVCSSFRILARSQDVVCRDCGAEFHPDDICNFAMTIDSKPSECPHCNTVRYGPCYCLQMDV